MTIRTAADLTADLDLTCDVCIVGSGAGGSVLAAGLAERGLDVIVLEEGSHHTRADWIALDESWSYANLYQERGTRATADQAIGILQGRSVGGSTTVNWTTCFRTPDRILDHWKANFGTELDASVLDPHWAAVEERLSIQAWPEALVNENNGVLLRGCRALGWQHSILRRNVNGCASSGYCGLGCPVDAKQAMHLTYLPDALAAGMRLFADTRADRFEVVGGRVTAVHATVMVPGKDAPGSVRVTVRPRVAVASGGAINTPTLLLRSGLDDERVGRRTFLHPVVFVAGRFDAPIRGWSGAPQSVSSHEFIDRGPDKTGFFIEVAPLQPALVSTALASFGARQADFMRQLEHVCGAVALSVDGLLPHDEGGTVSLRPDGRPRIDYPVRPHLAEAFRAATLALARLHLAAGAREVVTGHLDAVDVRSEADLPRLEAARYGAHEHRIFTAHQMGGCAMGADPERSVVDLALRHRRVENLFVVDGSVFPTALGVNPSLSIYGLAHWARDHVAAAV